MGKLPNGDRAIVDDAKIGRYLLDPTHRTGRHKAKVFASALGLTSRDSEVLEKALRLAAGENEASPPEFVDHGVQYYVEFELTHGNRTATIRSTWIILNGETDPRLVTAYVSSPKATR